MSIAFESYEVQLQRLRVRLRQMSDEELIKFGKIARGLTEPRVNEPYRAILAFAFTASWVRPECCIDPLRPPDSPGLSLVKPQVGTLAYDFERAINLSTRPLITQLLESRTQRHAGYLKPNLCTDFVVRLKA
jgi:hypothetical protein